MTSRKLLIAAGAAMLITGAAQAAGPANPDPTSVQPGTYKVESGHTRIEFSLSHMGFSTWYGDFTGASGSLTIDPRQPAAGQLSITLPIGSISTTSAKLDDELKAPDYLDATQFPTATFVSSRIVPKGAGQADVMGQLTLHGVTHPLTLHVKFNGAGINPFSKEYTVGFDATGMIKRSDFGVAKLVPLIGDEVELRLSGAFTKATQARSGGGTRRPPE